MDLMLALQQFATYQSEAKRTFLSAKEAHLVLTNDGSYNVKDISDSTFQTPGLHTHVIVNGIGGETTLDTFEVAEPIAPDFDLQQALYGTNNSWFLRAVHITDDDEVELVFLRNDSRRIVHDGVEDGDLQTVKITDACDELLVIFTADDGFAWVLSQTWVRADGRMLLRIWELGDGVKRSLYEKEGAIDGDDLFNASDVWLATYYNPPEHT